MKQITLLAFMLMSIAGNAQNTFPNSGNVGVNTTAPLNDFHVVGVMRWGGYSGDCVFSGQDGLGAYIEQMGSTAAKSKLRIQSSKSGDNTNYSQLMIDPQMGFAFTSLGNGISNVGIGTTDTRGYKLAVAGSVIAESLKVKNHAGWPDFVFARDYRLPSIPEVEAFVKAHNHLPGIPSAAEVATDGIDVGEMNKKLLQKVEELTLYLIEEHKKVAVLQAEMAELKASIHR
jgi:hypothetical protein